MTNEQKVLELRKKIESRIYREKGPKYQLANKVLFIVFLVMGLLCEINMVFLAKEYGISPYIIFCGIWGLAGVIVCSAIYIKDKSSNRLRAVCLVLFAVIYAVANITNTNNCMMASAIPVLIALMMFMDRKVMNLATSIFAGIAIVRIVGIAMGLVYSKNSMNQEAILLLILLVSYVTLQQANRISWRFNHDAMYSMKDEKTIQEIIMEDVLNIAKGVQNQTDEANSMINVLHESSSNISNVMREINYGTKNTADSIQNQTEMTQSIQQAIAEAADKATIALNKTKESMEEVNSSLYSMEELSEHSENITITNGKVVESMEKLSQKTEDVKEITDMILSISNQTNLLALNASIEAARAGEAGKGFAVVADQIRVLAEQTKKSTENITLIVQELNAYSREASLAIEDSLEATRQQTSLIETTRDEFIKINSNMEDLTNEVGGIDAMIDELKESNNAIVDSISQLSAVSEQITANSNEASEITMDNKESSEKARDLLKQVLDYSHELDKYMQ